MFLTPTAALCAIVTIESSDRSCCEVALKMRFAGCSDAPVLQKERALGLHRLHQRSDAHDLHDAFEVVGQYVKAHLGTDAR